MQIVEKGQGVFLWVTLVVRSLLEGMMNGDKLSDLQQRLDELPADLEPLFQSIWNSIEACYQPEFAQFVLVLDASTRPLSLLRLWIVNEVSALGRDTSLMPLEVKESLKMTMKRRLNSRTKGLLESSLDERVDFIHRTVCEWIYREDIWEKLGTFAGVTFDPNLELCRAVVVEFPSTYSVDFDPDAFRDITYLCMSYASRVRETAESAYKLKQILDRLDIKASKLFQTPDERGIFPLAGGTKEFPSMHWTRVLEADDFRLPHRSMVALAAICGVFPFVTAKVLKRPEAYSGKTLVAVLRCAILGFSIFVTLNRSKSEFDPGRQSLTSFVRSTAVSYTAPDRTISHHNFSRERVSLVSFLLDRCSSSELDLLREEMARLHHGADSFAILYAREERRLEGHKSAGENHFNYSVVVRDVYEAKMESLKKDRRSSFLRRMLGMVK